jgi:hypothetical protein
MTVRSFLSFGVITGLLVLHVGAQERSTTSPAQQSFEVASVRESEPPSGGWTLVPS